MDIKKLLVEYGHYRTKMQTGLDTVFDEAYHVDRFFEHRMSVFRELTKKAIKSKPVRFDDVSNIWNADNEMLFDIQIDDVKEFRQKSLGNELSAIQTTFGNYIANLINVDFFPDFEKKIHPINNILFRLSGYVFYDQRDQSIKLQNFETLIDVRGWGWIQQLKDAELIQDAIGEYLANQINVEIASINEQRNNNG